MLQFSERERAHSDHFKNVLFKTGFQPYFTFMYFIYFSTLKIDLTMNIKHLNLLTFYGVIRGLIVNVSEKYILA